MNPREIGVMEQELNEFRHILFQRYFITVFVKAHINRTGDSSKQFLRLTILGIYITEVKVDFTKDDLLSLMEVRPKTLIKKRLLDALDEYTDAHFVFDKISKDRHLYGRDYTSEELKNFSKVDAQSFRDLIDIIESI